MKLNQTINITLYVLIKSLCHQHKNSNADEYVNGTYVRIPHANGDTAVTQTQGIFIKKKKYYLYSISLKENLLRSFFFFFL